MRVILFIILILFILFNIRKNKNLNENYENKNNIYGFIDGWEKDYINHITSRARNKNIFVFTSNKSSYQEVKKIVKMKKPEIVIHLSDEFGTKSEYDNISKYTKLYLRNYYHPKYPKLKNINIMPLGYQKNMFNTIPINLSLKKIKDREYKWSFIGDFSKNKDRRNMIKELNSIPNSYIKNNIKPTEMKKIYMDSVFVPNARGNINLECFRLYEASACGAIPILVGNKKERKELIISQGNPPWIECETWKQAKNMINELKNEELQNKQDKIIKWWNERLKLFIDLISKV